jgi:16S rRNA (cytosine967-C5)-methyltransferase
MDQYLKMLPHKHQTDGFFAAVLQRKAKAKAAEAEKAADEAGEEEA